jgi:hypothetical protein
MLEARIALVIALMVMQLHGKQQAQLQPSARTPEMFLFLQKVTFPLVFLSLELSA